MARAAATSSWVDSGLQPDQDTSAPGGADGAHQHGGLLGHVQATGDLHPLQREVLLSLFPQAGQDRHAALGPFNLQPAGIGQLGIGDLEIRHVGASPYHMTRPGCPHKPPPFARQMGVFQPLLAAFAEARATRGSGSRLCSPMSSPEDDPAATKVGVTVPQPMPSMESDPLLGAGPGGSLRDRPPHRRGRDGRGLRGRATPCIGSAVAVKVLLEKFHAKTELVARLLQEARLASAIGHENIVDVTDFGTTADGRAFVVMEFLEGESLAAAGDARRAAGGRALPAHRPPGGQRAGRRARQGDRPPRREARERLPAAPGRRRTSSRWSTSASPRRCARATRAAPS